MRAPYPFFGGKTVLISKLMPLMPQKSTCPHIRLYIEPFFGSGAVFFAREPMMSEVVNDRDHNIVNFFQVLRTRTEEFQEKCYLTPFSREELRRCMAYEGDDEMERARCFFALMRMAYCPHHPQSVGFKVHPGQESGACEARAFMNTVDTFQKVRERMRHVYVENRPAIKILKRTKRSDCFIYCDPPYVHSTRVKGAYGHEMSEDDHVELLDTLKRMDGLVAISGYSNEIYDTMLKEWPQRIVLKSAIRVRAHKEKGRRKTEEVLWCNYNEFFSKESAEKCMF